MTEITESPRAPEIKTYPVKELGHSFAELFDLYYKLGQVTRERFAGNKGKNEGIERSVWARMERAQLLKKLKRNEISHRDSTIEKTKIDEVDRQFATQKDIQIDIPGLGIQSAYGTEVNLPDNLKTPEQISKPPIFFIPALSGDLYGVEPLMKELAMNGRRAISLAYPESFLGQTTEEFARSVGESTTYEPHTSYFKRAINKLLGEDSKFELWGYSTGSAIAAEILADPNFQQRAQNAVLISPVSVADQSLIDFKAGVFLKEGARLLTLQHGWKTSDVSMVLGSKTPSDENNIARRKRIFNALIDSKLIKKLDMWKNARVNNGEIIVVSGEKDKITKSNKAIGDFLELDQYNIIDFKKASHVTPLTRAKYLIGRILEIQDQKDHSRYVQI